MRGAVDIDAGWESLQEITVDGGWKFFPKRIRSKFRKFEPVFRCEFGFWDRILKIENLGHVRKTRGAEIDHMITIARFLDLSQFKPLWNLS